MNTEKIIGDELKSLQDGINKSTNNWSEIKDKDAWLNEVRGVNTENQDEIWLSVVNTIADKFLYWKENNMKSNVTELREELKQKYSITKSGNAG